MNKERKKDPRGLLLLDAGNLFFSKTKSSCDQKELGKADAILKSYQTMGYDAINLSQADLSVGVPFLLEKAKDMKLPFVSSNLIESGNEKTVFKPFIIKKINSGSDHAVGIFGLINKPQSMMDNDLDLWLSLYTDNTIKMPPDQFATFGKEELQAIMKPLFDNFTFEEFTLDDLEIQVAGSWAFSRCNFKVTMNPKAGGEPLHLDAKDLCILERQVDGSWKIAYDCWNSNTPPKVE